MRLCYPGHQFMKCGEKETLDWWTACGKKTLWLQSDKLISWDKLWQTLVNFDELWWTVVKQRTLTIFTKYWRNRNPTVSANTESSGVLWGILHEISLPFTCSLKFGLEVRHEHCKLCVTFLMVYTVLNTHYEQSKYAAFTLIRPRSSRSSIPNFHSSQLFYYYKQVQTLWKIRQGTLTSL